MIRRFSAADLTRECSVVHTAEAPIVMYDRSGKKHLSLDGQRRSGVLRDGWRKFEVMAGEICSLTQPTTHALER